MSLPIRLRRAAQSEYDKAADWYEARRPGLGLGFIRAVGQALADIANQPDRWAEVWPGVREAPVTGWPYFIYYMRRTPTTSWFSRFSTLRAIHPYGALVPKQASL